MGVLHLIYCLGIKLLQFITMTIQSKQLYIKKINPIQFLYILYLQLKFML